MVSTVNYRGMINDIRLASTFQNVKCLYVPFC